MSDVTLTPYIFFNGDCRDAIEFYHGIFGGELFVQTFEESPGDTPAGLEGKVMHASISKGEVDLMASDSTEASAKAAKVELSLNGEDEAKLTEMFTKLSEGGHVESPLKKEFWGAIFGKVTDRYGVDWMVNITTGDQPT